MVLSLLFAVCYLMSRSLYDFGSLNLYLLLYQGVSVQLDHIKSSYIIQ